MLVPVLLPQPVQVYTNMDAWNEDRWLADAYGKEKEPLDYTVLSVAVLTLGLILLVEVVRHGLDHEAKHRPFFKAVLETTYSECTWPYR